MRCSSPRPPTQLTPTHAGIEAHDLAKAYGQRKAVDGISFSVKPGEVFGILGPNGSGKTTTMRMIAGTLRRDGGRLSVLGMDPSTRGRDIRAIAGILPQEDALDPELTVGANLSSYGRYFGFRGADLRQRVTRALAHANLTTRAGESIDSLSGGMRRRLAYARALLNDPALLLLDEPTTALDPAARREIWDDIRHLAREHGLTVVLTSHFMDEAEYLCDRVAFLVDSRLIAQGTPNELIEQYTSPGQPRNLDEVYLRILALTRGEAQHE